MTGTLIDGRLSSAYPAIRVIEPRYYASYKNFLYQHAITDDFGTVIEWTNHAKIKRILAREAVAMTFEEAYKGSPKPIIIPENVGWIKFTSTPIKNLRIKHCWNWKIIT